MSEPTPPPEPKTPFPRVLLAMGVIGFFIFSLSIGGLAWWLVSRNSVPTNQSQAQPLVKAEEGSETNLFNGTDLDGWDFDPSVWSVRDGVIYGSQTRRGAGSALFWPGSDVVDFELRFRFQLIRGNAGVAYRATRLAGFDVGGYEFEIYTNKTGNLANVGTDRQRYRLHQAAATAEPTDSEWHEAVIIANGTRLIHMLDGNTLCNVEDTNPAAPRAGVIAFGMTTGTIVQFKDLRLKRMNGN